MKKKLTALLLALTMGLSMVACSVEKVEPAPAPAPAVPTSPKTADSFSVAVYAMMMLASGAAAVVVLKKREQF